MLHGGGDGGFGEEIAGSDADKAEGAKAVERGGRGAGDEVAFDGGGFVGVAVGEEALGGEGDGADDEVEEDEEDGRSEPGFDQKPD